MLHGGLAAHARREAIQDFVSGRARVLLATDAAGEGLNLQARCRIVLNIELPWNPLRLEQRIGRVDRLGQTRRVHALHLFHRESFEDEVLARLLRRARRAGVELGAGYPDEHAIAAAVFRGDALPEPAETVGASRTGADRRAFARATLDRRAMRMARDTRDSGSRRSRSCVVAPSPRTLAGGVVLLFECALHDGIGRLAGRTLLPVAIALTRPRRLHGRTILPFVEHLSQSAAVRAVVDRQQREWRIAVSEAPRIAGLTIARRLTHIVGRLTAVRGPALFQASLFDKRAEQRARASDAASAAWCEHLRHRADAALALTLMLDATPRLIAAWPIPHVTPRAARPQQVG